MAKTKTSPQATPAPPATDPKPSAAEREADAREREWREAGELRDQSDIDTETDPQPAPQPEPAPAPTVHKHSRRLINEAAEWLNLTRSEIDSRSEDDLEDDIAKAKWQYRVAFEKQVRAIQDRETRPAPSPQPQAEVDDLDKDLEGWEPSTKQVLKKLDARKEIAALKQQLAQMQEHLTARERGSIQQRLKAKAKEHGLTKAQDAAMMGYLRSLERQDAESLEDDFDEGVKLLGFAAQPSAAAPPSRPKLHEPDPEEVTLAERKAEWAKAGTAQATQRTGDEHLSDRERWIKNWDRKRREKEQSDEEFERDYGLNGK